jgi:CheY-like chemotaxis protein
MRPTCPRVAIVDDSAADASILELAIRRANPHAQITWFATASGVLEELSVRSKYDLIICDLRLGAEDAFTFLQQIRERWSALDLPVVVTSSFCGPEEVERCYGLGARWYFEKPFTLGRASEIVNELVSRWL